MISKFPLKLRYRFIFIHLFQGRLINFPVIYSFNQFSTENSSFPIQTFYTIIIERRSNTNSQTPELNKRSSFV